MLYVLGYFFIMYISLVVCLKWYRHKGWDEWGGAAMPPVILVGIFWPIALIIALIYNACSLLYQSADSLSRSINISIKKEKK